jgi:Fic family protein
MDYQTIDVTQMEPMLPEEGCRELDDLVYELIAKANSLAGQMNPTVAATVGGLIRSMNCYYSNFIEGHYTHPRDIDRALKMDFAEQPKRRNLQMEAVAHIEVQKAIDEGRGDKSVPLSSQYACWLHGEFCSRLPEEMLWVEETSTHRKIRVVPGQLRDGEVQVGQHVPPAATALPAFLARFDDAYNPEHHSKVRQIVAVAASHHRFAWIHPFYDGNGRVVRLMAHAMLTRLGVGNSLWSVARGLARNVRDYKSLLADADHPRRSDLDGRGALSQSSLLAFCKFFLATCVDQVEYMRSVLEPIGLLNRIKVYISEEVSEKRLPNGSYELLREALLSGEFERGQAEAITGYRERGARQVLSQLVEKGLLTSDGQRGPVRVGFPIGIVERFFPALYPTNPAST